MIYQVLIALTYVAEALGFLGIIVGMVMLVLSGPRSDQ